MAELRVIIEAKKLSELTLTVTSNCNTYPKKYRFSLVDRMQKLALDIVIYLMQANATDLRLYPRERSELQTRAITNCDILSCFIEMSYNLKIISDKRMGYWSKMVTDVKHMAIAWRTKDKQR